MKILAIDTSNQTLSVAICNDQQLIGQYTGTTNKNHSLALMPAIDFIMKENQITPQGIERIVVAQGPGSYTGLRIGVTTAKTLAWTLGVELVGISSLASLAANSLDYQGLIVPLFDARRNNVYTGIYQWQGSQLVTIVPDKHISFEQWLLELENYDQEMRFVGSDLSKFSQLIEESLVKTTIDLTAAYHEVNSLSLAKLGLTGEVVPSVEDFVPAYLKLVEAEENWLANNNNHEQRESYVEKI